ncbi:hypothetical protein HMPREF9193_01432 [Treponema lecithinolyticum ATCC 700332]|uniref:Uncharacterized protein n=1 Tax=Treponema lecithinolyticum ATCC 700332 TaxID=1321815 RepID=A0ABN0NYG9_TRELE|nr:hypothetical protein HMPREF9193_01432 [Treponema lecithinolyticum ATCC 700332]
MKKFFKSRSIYIQKKFFFELFIPRFKKNMQFYYINSERDFLPNTLFYCIKTN